MIALGTVQNQPLGTQFFVVSLIALIMTAGVYGLVAGIVKMDDAGLYLVKNSQEKSLKQIVGNGLLSFAPKLMRSLATIGTIAMFLVGGSIVVHSIPHSHEMLEHLMEATLSWPQLGGFTAWSLPVLIDAITGVLSGAVVLMVVSLAQKLRTLSK